MDTLNNDDKRLKSFWVPFDGTIQESGEVPKITVPQGYEYSESPINSETTPLRKPALSTRFFRVKEVPNTSIYAVVIDAVPKFYCATHDDAIRKARNFLEASRKHFDRKYFLDNLPNGEIHLTSVNKFFVFQNETLEHVAKIWKIPQVRFMVE
jgi:hypothetical protein